MIVRINTAEVAHFSYLMRIKNEEICVSLIILLKLCFVIMHLVFVFITIFAVSQAANENQQTAFWNLFKRVHNKQYPNAEEEQYR